MKIVIKEDGHWISDDLPSNLAWPNTSQNRILNVIFHWICICQKVKKICPCFGMNYPTQQETFNVHQCFIFLLSPMANGHAAVSLKAIGSNSNTQIIIPHPHKKWMCSWQKLCICQELQLTALCKRFTYFVKLNANKCHLMTGVSLDSALDLKPYFYFEKVFFSAQAFMNLSLSSLGVLCNMPQKLKPMK